jgi:hypothetical protein
VRCCDLKHFRRSPVKVLAPSCSATICLHVLLAGLPGAPLPSTLHLLQVAIGLFSCLMALLCDVDGVLQGDLCGQWALDAADWSQRWVSLQGLGFLAGVSRGPAPGPQPQSAVGPDASNGASGAASGSSHDGSGWDWGAPSSGPSPAPATSKRRLAKRAVPLAVVSAHKRHAACKLCFHADGGPGVGSSPLSLCCAHPRPALVYVSSRPLHMNCSHTHDACLDYIACEHTRT